MLDSACDELPICRNLPGSFTCECNDGFRQKFGRCVDIDECDEFEFDFGECVNEEGGFYLNCVNGYS